MHMKIRLENREKIRDFSLTKIQIKTVLFNDYIKTTKRTHMRINGKIRENHLIISNTKIHF